MKTLQESIIGRKGSYKSSSKIPGQLYPGQNLEYGDIVKLSTVPRMNYICLPTSQCDSWWTKRPHAQVVLVRYDSYLEPSHAPYTCDLTKNYEFIRYVREYRNIKTPEDLKAVFDKYNIPYE